MHKFPLFIALCVALSFYSVMTTANPKLEVLGDGEYAIYSREVVKSHLVQRRVASGIGYIYYTDSQNAEALRQKFNYIDGESIVIEAKSAHGVFAQLGVREVSAGNGIFYGYSPRGKSFIKSDGRKINLQVVERNGSTVVGWPVILGSY